MEDMSELVCQRRGGCCGTHFQAKERSSSSQPMRPGVSSQNCFRSKLPILFLWFVSRTRERPLRQQPLRCCQCAHAHGAVRAHRGLSSRPMKKSYAGLPVSPPAASVRSLPPLLYVKEETYRYIDSAAAKALPAVSSAWRAEVGAAVRTNERPTACGGRSERTRKLSCTQDRSSTPL